MFRGGFRRSSLFRLIGVIVVAALVVVIPLTTGEGQSNPQTTYALIFGVLVVFLIGLFVLQRSDLNRVSSVDAKAVQRAVAEGKVKVDDPTRMPEQQLWASMAVTLLIFLTVPPIYFFESFVPLLIGGPLIAIAAIYGGVRALMPGGEMDQGYARVGTAMSPLGLEVSERPTVSIETREATTGRMGPVVHGNLVLSGQRHGRDVSVRLESRKSEVIVGDPCQEFSAKSCKLTVESGPEGIEIVRKGGGQGDWLCDLWLAERLADAC